MNIPLFRILIFGFILFSAGLLKAQESILIPASDSILSIEIDEVVVSANRYGSFRMKTPEAIRVLDKQSFEKYQMRTAPEALLKTPGVFVQKTNHGGGSPFIRGLTGNQTLLLIDGIRLSNAIVRYGPNQYFNTIDIFSIEKMEVMRGTGSVQYGSDALGGAIQAFSHSLETSPEPQFSAKALTRIGSQKMEQSLRGEVEFRSKKSAIRTGISLRNFGDLVGGDTTGRQNPSGYNEIDFDIKAKFVLSESSELSFLYQDVHQGDVPVYHKIALENFQLNRMDPQKRKLAYIRLNQRLDAGIFKSVRLTLSMQNNEEKRESMKNGSLVLHVENDGVRSLGFSAEIYAENQKGWSSSGGLEITNDLVSSKREDINNIDNSIFTRRGLYPDGSSMSGIAVFNMHTLDLQNWTITAGGRFNSYMSKVTDEISGIIRIKPAAVAGSVAIMRKLNGISGLFVSAANGFRAPNIDDLGTLGIVDFRYETPNFSLKPEHSFQYQAGYKFNRPVLKGEAYLFRNELYDLIVRNKIPGDSIDGYAVYRKDNVERAYVQGAETAWDFELTQSLIFSGSLTYTFGQNITKAEPLRRIPPVFGRFGMEYRLMDWWVNVEYMAAGKQSRLAAGDKDDNRIPKGGTPGWNVINLSTGYSFRFIKIDFSLLNLLNTDYRFHGSGVNGYGRSAFLTLSLSI